jgi:4-diphosphocytidyl-2-C-methyl-D-erythritol kinase
MLRFAAPAKLNLYLRVCGTRPDGYHELETVFQRIDLADALSFEPHPDALQLTCTDSTLSCGADNLVMKAARLLQRRSGTHHGARIHLIKRIPVAAGLGGGSSDAAATLLGLNVLWQLGLEPAQLVELAGQLGADAPFFLCPEPAAIGRGRGDLCEPVVGARALDVVLVVPDTRLSTREIFETADFGLTAPKPSITMVAHALCNGSLDELAKGLWNDLAPEAIRRCPVISAIQLQLSELGCIGTGMSGSGPAVFGLCRDARHAEHVVRAMPAALTSTSRYVGIVRTSHEPYVSSRRSSEVV